jgi:hypothetical protein
MTNIRIEINKKTGKWRFLDMELGVYSSDEWDTRNEAFKMSDKYRKKHGLKKHERV